MNDVQKFIADLKQHDKYDKSLDDWDPDKFDWTCSKLLPVHYKEYFHIWFNKKYYQYEHTSWSLASFCYKYFLIWWDSDKFHKSGYSALVDNCYMYFNIWWPDIKDKIDKPDFLNENLYGLSLKCSDYFLDWFDKDAIRPLKIAECIDVICKNNAQQFDIWWNKDILANSSDFIQNKVIENLILHCSNKIDIWAQDLCNICRRHPITIFIKSISPKDLAKIQTRLFLDNSI